MATKNEIRDRAATMLGLLRLGQSLQHQDSVRLLEAYDEVYEELKDVGIATWASTAEVPTKVARYVAAMVALNGLASYGVSDARYNRIVLMTGVDGEQARAKIRSLVMPDYVSFDDGVDY